MRPISSVPGTTIHHISFRPGGPFVTIRLFCFPVSGRFSRNHRPGKFLPHLFGVNDGLVSNFSLGMGFAGAEAKPEYLLLAGIAGFVLSVGMAVDANILIFERTKEELRAGKTLPAAVEAGFNRAWNSILDSNVSSLITAGILFWFGTSVIRGFALVLIIGVLTSMFTAITVSRTILRFVVGQPALRKAWMWGVSEEEFLARPATRVRSRREAATRV